jgi:hypothetical protein
MSPKGATRCLERAFPPSFDEFRLGEVGLEVPPVSRARTSGALSGFDETPHGEDVGPEDGDQYRGARPAIRDEKCQGRDPDH